MIEKEVPSLSDLREHPKQLIDDVLIEKIHEIGEKLPDDTRVEDLKITRLWAGKRAIKRNAPPEWESFVRQLPHAQRAVLLSCISQAYTAGYETLGEIRTATYQQLIDSSINRSYPRRGAIYIGPIRASILKRCF